MGTKFTEVYNCFLSKITDDMYLELTPKDTVEDLQNLLINSIPYFEFPRVVISDYEIKTEIILNEEVQEDDFIISTEKVVCYMALDMENEAYRELNKARKLAGNDTDYIKHVNELQKLLKYYFKG